MNTAGTKKNIKTNIKFIQGYLNEIPLLVCTWTMSMDMV